MAIIRTFRSGPFYISGVTPNGANLIKPADSFTSPTNLPVVGYWILLTHVSILNTAAISRAFSLFIGASLGEAAGTEFIGKDIAIAAHGNYDWYGATRVEPSEYVTGFGSDGTSLVMTVDGEMHVTN